MDDLKGWQNIMLAVYMEIAYQLSCELNDTNFNCYDRELFRKLSHRDEFWNRNKMKCIGQQAIYPSINFMGNLTVAYYDFSDEMLIKNNGDGLVKWLDELPLVKELVVNPNDICDGFAGSNFLDISEEE